MDKERKKPAAAQMSKPAKTPAPSDTSLAPYDIIKGASDTAQLQALQANAVATRAFPELEKTPHILEVNNGSKSSEDPKDDQISPENKNKETKDRRDPWEVSWP